MDWLFDIIGGIFEWFFVELLGEWVFRGIGRMFRFIWRTVRGTNRRPPDNPYQRSYKK